MNDTSTRLETDYVIGAKTQAKRKGGTALVAVRVPTDLLRRVHAYAEDRGITVSDVLRLGTERLISDADSASNALTTQIAFETGVVTTSSIAFTDEPAQLFAGQLFAGVTARALEAART